MSIKDSLDTLKIELTPTGTRLIAVTKYCSINQMVEAYEAGIRDFGESKLQSVLQKWETLPQHIVNNVNWHFIGHLQSKKVKNVAGKFCLIHSVDSLKLAEKISIAAESLNITQDILIQVNISREESKFGFFKEDLLHLFPELLKLKHLNIKGLMTMAPNTEDLNLQRECFRNLKTLKNQLEDSFTIQLPELSMGMSNDYKVAIEEGSTYIRIGQRLFSE